MVKGQLFKNITYLGGQVSFEEEVEGEQSWWWSPIDPNWIIILLVIHLDAFMVEK